MFICGSKLADGGCLGDVKSAMDVQEVEKNGVSFWRL